MNKFKNMKRKSAAALCAAVLAVGCAGVMPVSAEDTLYTFEPYRFNVKILGRAMYLDEQRALWFGLTDSGVEFTFTGKTVAFDLLADSSAVGENAARMKLICDGETVSDFMLKNKNDTIAYDFDEAGTHTVSLIKVSEAENGTVRLDNIRTDSKYIAPTASKARKIEFIGDSITCGYGVDAANENEHFSTKTEDGTKTYAYKAAKALDMDYSMVSYSGFGIISGYTTDGKRNTTSTLPPYNDKLGFSWWSDFDNGTQMNTVDWDFNAFVPDVIVVNLGTNDASYISSVKGADDKKSEREAYTAEYKNFIKQLRAKNPNAYILCTLGIMGQDLYNYMAKAVDEYKTETGDTNVGAMKFDLQDWQNDGLGADWHPSGASHTKAADKLVEELKPIIENLPAKEYLLPDEPSIEGVYWECRDHDKNDYYYALDFGCDYDFEEYYDCLYDSYTIMYKAEGDSEYTTVTVPASEFKYFFSDLKPNTKYTITVRGSGVTPSGDVFTKDSAPFELTTGDEFVMPAPPVISDESEVTSDSITLKWSKVEGAESYELYYLPTERLNDENWTGLVRIADITDTSYKVEGLGAGTEYRFWVTATVNTPDGGFAEL